MSFSPAEYCARIMAAVRAGVIRPSGVTTNSQRVRKADWNALGASQARDTVAAVAAAAAALVGGAPRITTTSPTVGQWADHFGRCIGQFSLMADRAHSKGVVEQSLDLLDADDLAAVYEYIATEYRGVAVRLGTQRSFLERLSVPMITTEIVDSLLATPALVALGRAEIMLAVTHYTQDPAAHLWGMVDAIARMQADPRYAEMDPSVLKHVASKWPANPERALDHMIATRDELRADARFAHLSDRTVWFAATNNPKRSAAFLETVVSTIESFRSDPAFGEVPSWMLEHVAVRHSKAPQHVLTQMMLLRESLLAGGYGDLGATAVHTAVAHRSRNPYPYLEAVRERLTQLRASSFGAIFPDSELSRVAAVYTDPTGFLERVLVEADALAAQMEGTSFPQRARFCAYYPERTRALMAGAPVTADDIRRALDRRDRTVSEPAAVGVELEGR